MNRRLNMGGRQITEYMCRLRGNLVDESYINLMKEEHGYIALDLNKEIAQSSSSTFFSAR